MSDVYYLIMDREADCSDFRWCGTRIQAIHAENFMEAEQEAKTFLQENNFFKTKYDYGLNSVHIALACPSIPFGKWEKEYEAEKEAARLAKQKQEEEAKEKEQMYSLMAKYGVKEA